MRKKIRKKNPLPLNYRLLANLYLCSCLFFFQIRPLGAVTMESVNTTNSSGETSTATRVYEEDVDAGQQEFVIGYLTLISAVMLSPTLIAACRKPSTFAFAAVSGAFLASEIGAFRTYKSASSREMAFYVGDENRDGKDENEDGVDDQLQGLQTAINITKEAITAAKRRRDFTYIVAAGYGAAATLSVLESFALFGLTPCTGVTNIKAPSPEKLEYDLQRTSFQKRKLFEFLAPQDINLLSSTSELMNLPDEDDQFMLHYQERMALKNGDLHSMTLQEYKETQEGLSFFSKEKGEFPSQGERNIRNEREGFIKKSFIAALNFTSSLFVKNTFASSKGKWKGEFNTARKIALGVGILGGAASLAATLSASSLPLFLASGVSRAAIMGVMGGAAILASTETVKALNDLRDRKRNYQSLYNTLQGALNSRKNHPTEKGAQTTSQSTQKITASLSGTDGNELSSCFTGSGTTVQEDKDCSCLESKSCKKASLPDITNSPNFPGKSTLTSSLDAFKNQANALYSGKSLTGANTSSESLKKAAGRINKLRDALGEKAFSKLKDKKGNPVHYKDQVEKLSQKIRGKIKSGLNKLSAAERSSLANLSSGGLPPSSKDSQNKKGNGKSKLASAVGGKGKIKDSTSPNSNSSGALWDLDFKEDENGEKITKEDLAQLASGEEEYEIDGDINDNPDKNLFNIITGRYLKSAYPVIFDEQ